MYEFATTNLIISSCVAIFIGGSYLWMRHLIKLKERAFATVSRLDVALQKRHRLTPEIVQIVDKFMHDQRDLVADSIALLLEPPVAPAMNEITLLRRYLAHAEKLGEILHFMCALAPKYSAYAEYPELDGLLDAFYANERELADARHAYNKAVSNLRVGIALFPATLYAQMVGVRELPQFEGQEAHDMRGKAVLSDMDSEESSVDITYEYL
ncbi:MAG: LemA family protein [Pseudomonadota bacterium]|jgi:LemA protein|nr:LemA family protein [Pseudomonadota bacterium]MEE3323672.1 LemA family protein [Pseudomonadota bacterium]